MLLSTYFIIFHHVYGTQWAAECSVCRSYRRSLESLELQWQEWMSWPTCWDQNPGLTRQEQLPCLTPRRASFPVLVSYVHMCMDVSTCHMCGVMCRVRSVRGEQKALSPLTPADTSCSDRLRQWEEWELNHDTADGRNSLTETSAQAPTATTSETCNLKMQASCEYK